MMMFLFPSIMMLIMKTPSLSFNFIPLFIILLMIKFNSFMNLNMMNFLFMVDLLTLMMLLLTATSCILIMWATHYPKLLKNSISFIFLTLIMTFSSSNMFMFYLMFEIVLIPTMFIITKWGNQPERLQAAIYLILYTLFASLPLLISILNLNTNCYMMENYMKCYYPFFSIFFIIAFLVKAPLYLAHLWLPKAHVEAPVEGSMILAAILLKLGGYGLIRFIPLLIPKIMVYNFWVISISLMGAIISCVTCLRQNDLKALIAYSSISHMGFTMASIFMLNMLGYYGAIIMMIAHGMVSSALFLLVNSIYLNYHSRNIMNMKGLYSIVPNMTFWWFLFIMANMSVPPSINLVGEMMMMMSLFVWTNMMMLPTLLMLMLTTLFSIMLFLNTSHNQMNILTSNTYNTKLYLTLTMHILPTILLMGKLEMMVHF